MKRKDGNGVVGHGRETSELVLVVGGPKSFSHMGAFQGSGDKISIGPCKGFVRAHSENKAEGVSHGVY